MPGTTYLSNKILDSIFRGSSTWTRTPNLYFALFTSAPNASGGGVEVAGGSYVRVAVTATTAAATFEMTQSNPGPPAVGNDNATPGNHLFNAKAIIWPRPTAAWGDVVAFGIYDLATGGNLLYYDMLPQVMPINAYQRPTLPIRSLEFSLGGGVGGLMESKILNYFLRGVAIGISANTVRVTLMTAGGSGPLLITNEINPTHLVTQGGVITAGRVIVPFTSWSAAGGAALTNGTAITFRFATNTPAYTVTQFALVLTTATGAIGTGEVLFYGDLGASTTIPSGASVGSVTQDFTWPPGGLTLQFDT
jgi:hypothetical protein